MAKHGLDVASSRRHLRRCGCGLVRNLRTGGSGHGFNRQCPRGANNICIKQRLDLMGTMGTIGTVTVGSAVDIRSIGTIGSIGSRCSGLAEVSRQQRSAKVQTQKARPKKGTKKGDSILKLGCLRHRKQQGLDLADFGSRKKMKPGPESHSLPGVFEQMAGLPSFHLWLLGIWSP